MRELDIRDVTQSKDTPARQAELHSLELNDSNQLPGRHRIRVKRIDGFTGNPSLVSSEAAPAEKGNYVQRALEHVSGIRRTLGLRTTQPPEFITDPHEHKTSSGAVAVHLQQQYKGIPIFQASETVRFSPNGALKETAGTSITITEDYEVSPKVSASRAVKIACQHAAAPGEDEQDAVDEFGESFKFTAVDVTGFSPKCIAAFADKPDQPAMFEAGPFGDKLKAGLLWFPLENGIRLCWEVIVTMPNFEGQFRILVDADKEDILYCRQLVQAVVARGNVFHVDGGQNRRMTDFPRPLQDYGLPIPDDLPPGFVDDWVDQQESVGNSVNAHLGYSGRTLTADNNNGVATFDTGDPTGDDQKILNIFYFNCYMHDYFYLLGFREEDGNFQHENLGRGGLASDRVDARAHSGPVYGTANMGTPVDGLNPVMNMGLVTSTGNHTAFDSSVVFHEFVHGVTNRLVGGRMNDRALEAPQSSGMGEGWSDYFACTINNSIIVGAWVTGNPSGIRKYPYDSDFPDNFGDLGTGRYTGRTPDGRSWPHPIGEIWCATLLEMNRQIGADLGVQLAVDALKLTPANPGFLDARDAILLALDDKLSANQLTEREYKDAKRGIWQAFARFGMGPNAASNGAWLSGIVPDFDAPVEGGGGQLVTVEASPNIRIPDDDQLGISSALRVTALGKIARVVVSVDIQHPYIGDLTVNLIAPDGQQVELHKREGASSDNIHSIYSSDDIADLSRLLGQLMEGTWQLHVVDMAARDVGTLRHWKLEITPAVDVTEPIRINTSPALTIPDNDPTGVASVIEVTASGNVQKLKVDLDITHTYVGDLRVVLAAPSGQQAILHNREGDGQDNLITNYDSDSDSLLNDLKGEQILGNWILRITDLAGRDVGKLNRWGLEIYV